MMWSGIVRRANVPPQGVKSAVCEKAACTSYRNIEAEKARPEAQRTS